MLTGHGGSDAPQRLAAMVNPAGLVRLTWDPPIDAVGVTGYVIEAGAGPGRSDLGVIPAHGQSFAIGAIPNGTYFVRVRAVMASGPGAASNEVVLQVGTQQQCTAAPAAPRLSTSVAGSILELVWAPGVGDAPTGYILDVGTTPGRRDIISVPLGADITTLSAQVEDGTYALRLTAVNGCGASAWGSDATVTIGGPALALPGAPTNLTEQVNGRAATLTWAPAASGGEPTTYRLEVLAPNGLVILTLDTGNVSTTFTHDNVPPGQYTVRVRGVNARGAGAPSNAVVLTIQ